MLLTKRQVRSRAKKFAKDVKSGKWDSCSDIFSFSELTLDAIFAQENKERDKKKEEILEHTRKQLEEIKNSRKITRKQLFMEFEYY